MMGSSPSIRDAATAFERIGRLATARLGVPRAYVALPAEDPLDREVAGRGEPLVIGDTAQGDVAAYAGFPLFGAGEAIGVFAAVDDRPREWGDEELEALGDFAALAQTEVDRRQAESTTAMLEQLVALTDAARGAKGTEAMLQTVSEQARRTFAADGVAIVLLALDGESRRRAGVGVLATPPSPSIDPRGFAGAVLAGREALAVADLRAAGFADSALVRAGLGAAMGTPLVAGGRTTGFMIVATHAPRAWAPSEVELLQLTAERLAGALEREEGHDADRAIADTLQRALLPAPLPEVAGLQLASRYEPAENRIGGDWYDVFELADGSVGLAIGDVVGHGIAAAAAAVRLRHFLRGAVLRGEGPGGVVATLNALVEDEPDAAYSSMVYLVLDPRTGAFRWAAAGHLPPARLRDGSAELLQMAGGTLLGVARLHPWPEGVGVLEHGDRLVLYTDGLVEQPGANVDTLTRVLMTGAAAAPGAEPVAAALVAAIPAPRRDDVAVLVAARS
jgi:GAF domain-containing protein